MRLDSDHLDSSGGLCASCRNVFLEHLQLKKEKKKWWYLNVNDWEYNKQGKRVLVKVSRE